MKGLLHRLAARAAGTTVLVRSDARLPFGAANLGWGEITEIEAPLGPAVIEAAGHPARSGEAARLSTQSDGSRHAAPAPILHRRSTPSPQDLGANERTASLTTPPPAPFVPKDDFDSRLPAGLVVGRSPDEVQTPPIRTAPNDLPAQQPPATQLLPPSRRPDVAMRLNGEPSLLMPRLTAERVSTLSTVPASATGPIGPNVGVPAADEPTEVHVHIGRIEVTAVQEAPAQHRKPRPKQAPMSLEAYLATRSRT